jgi:general stress protein 26
MSGPSLFAPKENSMPTAYANEQSAELADKIKSVRFVMLTTIDDTGQLISRPMTTQDMDADGSLWFYTSINSDLWENIVNHPEVNLAYSEPAEHLYVSVSGQAERVVDRAEIRARWNPGVQAWYPNGPDDEHVALLRVVPHTAEYWDSSGNAMVQMFRMAKAVLTGTRAEGGEHGRVTLQ